MSDKMIPWVQIYPYFDEEYRPEPDAVPTVAPDSITDDEVQKLIDAGFEFITHFDGPDPFTNPTTLILRRGNKQFMTKLPTIGLQDFARTEPWAEMDDKMAKLLRAALDDLVAFGHDGKSA